MAAATNNVIVPSDKVLVALTTGGGRITNSRVDWDLGLVQFFIFSPVLHISFHKKFIIQNCEIARPIPWT